MTRCSLCRIFQKEGFRIENQVNGSGEEFPESFFRLVPYLIKQEGEHAEKILQCPECGLLYVYSRSLPGGSYDAMETWVVERLEPLMKKGIHVKKEIKSDTENHS